MGLVKDMLFTNNYHKIESVEFHILKEQLRIRTNILKDLTSRQELGVKREYVINKKVLINSSADEAERSLSAKEIKKVAQEHVDAAEKELTDGKVLNKVDKDKIKDRVKFYLISEKQKVIGNNKILAVLNDLKKKSILNVAYNCLKMLGEFKGATDA